MKPDRVNPRPLLLHAHPGHELRLFRWMQCHRPVVFLLTDGSGGGGTSRLSHSEQCIESAAASVASQWVPTPDRSWYRAMLRGDCTASLAAVETLTKAAAAEGSNLIVSDAVDGYNPMHDLCEAIAAAVAIRRQRAGGTMTHLVSYAVPVAAEEAALEFRLPPAAVQRKRAAIEAYRPLAEEARRLLAAEPDALATERLHRPTFAWPAQSQPEWEATGRARVTSERYGEAITYAAHVRPIASALLDAARSG